jgi:mannitol-1-/sugar-/sorbitol-6-/2-deoxyglucose-6-phosphatase
MIKAVIFDMDGVLIDSEPLWKIGEKKAFAKVGISLTTEMCNLTMGYRSNEVVDYWYEKFPWEGISKIEVEEDMVKSVTDEIRYKGKAMVGVDQALNIFKENNFKIGLASSSSSKIINVVIDQLGIRHFFDVVQSAENEEYGKPHPAVFLQAAAKLKVHPTHCLVIEDSVNGVIAAKAARMKVMAIPDHSLAGDKRFAIADLMMSSLNHLDISEIMKNFNS